MYVFIVHTSSYMTNNCTFPSLTQKHTHTHTHTPSLSLFLSFFLSFSLSLFLSFSRRQSYYPNRFFFLFLFLTPLTSHFQDLTNIPILTRYMHNTTNLPKILSLLYTYMIYTYMQYDTLTYNNNNVSLTPQLIHQRRDAE